MTILAYSCLSELGKFRDRCQQSGTFVLRASVRSGAQDDDVGCAICFALVAKLTEPVS